MFSKRNFTRMCRRKFKFFYVIYVINEVDYGYTFNLTSCCKSVYCNSGTYISWMMKEITIKKQLI